MLKLLSLAIPIEKSGYIKDGGLAYLVDYHCRQSNAVVFCCNKLGKAGGLTTVLKVSVHTHKLRGPNANTITVPYNYYMLYIAVVPPLGGRGLGFVGFSTVYILCGCHEMWNLLLLKNDLLIYMLGLDWLPDNSFASVIITNHRGSNNYNLQAQYTLQSVRDVLGYSKPIQVLPYTVHCRQ